MAAICFVVALICFAVDTFGGHIAGLNLIAFGLMWMAAGHLLGGSAIDWVRKHVS